MANKREIILYYYSLDQSLIRHQEFFIHVHRDKTVLVSLKCREQYIYIASSVRFTLHDFGPNN